MKKSGLHLALIDNAITPNEITDFVLLQDEITKEKVCLIITLIWGRGKGEKL